MIPGKTALQSMSGGLKDHLNKSNIPLSSIPLRT